MRFQERVVLVTGAARGIGRGCAEHFLREGASVLLADIDADAGRETTDALASVAEHTEAVRFAHCDVSDRASVQRAVDLALSTWGRLDVCVANAAIVHGADFLDLEEADFDRVLDINLKGVFLTGQAAARAMVQCGNGGSIVNMSSINADVALPNQVPYCVAKGGIQQLTKVIALSLAEHGIRANAVGPGSIGTEMLESVISSDPAARKKVLSRTPAGRLGRVEEIAAVTAFLASDEASYVTGQTLYADGGRLALNYTVPVPDDD
jgi:NAD(P)-dependent dehydrogenase (short-subunit alcohol dehydrogenase family)